MYVNGIISNMINFKTFSLIVLFIFTAPVFSYAALIDGIILTEKGPLVESHVSAYRSFTEMRDGAPASISVSGDRRGFYRLDLSPGIYYLSASGADKEGEYYSFHGANPITVEDNDLWIPFMVLPVKNVLFNKLVSNSLRGRVTFRGEPVAGAQVSVYSVNDITFRGMGFFTSTTDSDGGFRMDPEPGEYVVIARKRKGFTGMRPLVKGDLFCYFPGGPVKVLELQETYMDLPCYPKDDLDAFLDAEVYPSILVKKSGEGSVRFREKKLYARTDSVKISGRVLNLKGRPMPDMYVKAYKGMPDNMFQMLYVRTMPEYMVRTDSNGYYSMDITDKGTFHLVARELIGEAPKKGEYYGLYEGAANHSILVADKPQENIDMNVSRVMAGRKAKKKELCAEDEYIKDHHFKEDTVLSSDTVWSGEIIIDGLVHVARGATLTISPGTVVKFRNIDRNGDGVGDGKIKVSGRLVAEGEPDSMISFVSAEPEPSKMDWSYLIFFASADNNVIRYCRFEHAFTGVQVHFSRAAISDSVFTNNHEGIRFGRTELDISHNDITGNSYGIRFTRLEGPVIIEKNNIKDNRVGVFHVPSNQSIVDFSETFEKKEVFHEHQPVVRSNNISYNYEYNYRLGERQGYNILLKDNWWGAADADAVSETIYDSKMDSTLGDILFRPYLSLPVNDAGVRRGG